ncbi:MAG: hypothetical protein DWQ36_00160 [Acidobacteria bacterium]|nr:MAG: hypothetical protein DWQ30_05795 [Acidobacteriota bacterium]REK12117.1 MAG: hypothetical protein DWQ36_00160 [Acidobacteriota bacterium]
MNRHRDVASTGAERRRYDSALGGLFVIVLLASLLAAPTLAQPAGDPQPVAPPVGDAEDDAETDAAGEDLDSLLADDTSGVGSPIGDDLGADEGDLSLIEDLLAEGEDALQTSYVYDGGGRRDPFRSLLVVADRAEGPAGPRPEGIPGLLIDEVTLTGVWITGDGPVAQVQSADQAVSYLLREGDRLFDGDVISITHSREDGGEIRFRQIVDDPTAPKPFRDVVRKLEP